MPTFPTLSKKPDYGIGIEKIDSTLRSPTEDGIKITRTRHNRITKKFSVKYDPINTTDVQLLEVFERLVGCSTIFYWINDAEARDTEKWTANKEYSVGYIIRPTTVNGHSYKCTIAGTSHASTQPTWPTTANGTVVDNTVTWIENIYSVRLAVPIKYTDKSYGLWSVDIELEEV